MLEAAHCSLLVREKTAILFWNILCTIQVNHVSYGECRCVQLKMESDCSVLKLWQLVSGTCKKKVRQLQYRACLYTHLVSDDKRENHAFQAVSLCNLVDHENHLTILIGNWSSLEILHYSINDYQEAHVQQCRDDGPIYKAHYNIPENKKQTRSTTSNTEDQIEGASTRHNYFKRY